MRLPDFPLTFELPRGISCSIDTAESDDKGLYLPKSHPQCDGYTNALSDEDHTVSDESHPISDEDRPTSDENTSVSDENTLGSSDSAAK